MSGSLSVPTGCYMGIRLAPHTWSHILVLFPWAERNFTIWLKEKKVEEGFSHYCDRGIVFCGLMWTCGHISYQVTAQTRLLPWENMTRVIWSQGAASCLLIARLHKLFKSPLQWQAEHPDSSSQHHTSTVSTSGSPCCFDFFHLYT